MPKVNTQSAEILKNSSKQVKNLQISTKRQAFVSLPLDKVDILMDIYSIYQEGLCRRKLTNLFIQYDWRTHIMNRLGRSMSQPQYKCVDEMQEFFERLWIRYGDDVETLICSTGVRSSDVEDIRQQIFLDTWSWRNLYPVNIEQFDTIIWRLTMTRCLSYTLTKSIERNPCVHLTPLRDGQKGTVGLQIMFERK